MKRVLKWLESKFSWHSSDVGADDHHAPLEVRPEENVKEENSGSGDTATLPILKSSKAVSAFGKYSAWLVSDGIAI